MLRLIVGFVSLGLAIMVLWQLDGRGLLSLLSDNAAGWPALLITGLLYALLLSIPFVPGLELGWAIIAMFGRPGIVVAWGASIAGLSLGFALASLLHRHARLERIQQKRTALLNTADDQLSVSMRVLRKCLGWHHRHPYLFVMLGLNIPGNWVIGGGGGIAWISGVAPEIRFPGFLIASTAATGILPLFLLATT